MKLAVPDMISNSYFPAIAAIELGFFKQEGLDVSLELIFPVDKAYAALREGAINFVGGSAHSALSAFPDWQGAKLICATIAPVPGSLAAGVNFGVTAARALEERVIDGFWANGMGAEVAVERGVGTVVLDVRRGDGPKPCFNYTMASMATTERLIERSPDTAAAAVRAIVNTQAALKGNVALAGEVGRKLFPPAEAALIAELIRRDLPFYDATISPTFVAGMNQFARDLGILGRHVAYEDVVATRFSHLWKG